MRDDGPDERKRDPWVEGAFGFIWAFTAALLVCGSGVVMALALGTHLLIQLRPSTTRVVNYDPSTVASVAFIPVVVGLILGWLYLRRLRRYRDGLD